MAKRGRKKKVTVAEPKVAKDEDVVTHKSLKVMGITKVNKAEAGQCKE